MWRRAPRGPLDFIGPQCGGGGGDRTRAEPPHRYGEPGGAVGTSLPQAAAEWGPTGTYP